MKKVSRIILQLAVSAITLISCGSSQQNKAKETADKIQETMKNTMPGQVAVSDNGYTMTATIDGKKWSAKSMRPPADVSRIIGYVNEEYVAIPYKKHAAQGDKEEIDGSADFNLHDYMGIWKSKGEVVYTKVKDGWAEGTFHATFVKDDGSRTIEIKDGFFRVATTE